MGVTGNLFSFRGRTSRAGYWRAQRRMWLGSTVVFGLLIFAAINDAPTWLLVFGFIAGMIAFAAHSVAIIVRRLHDRGYSGWWAVLFHLVVLMPLAAIAGPQWISPTVDLPFASESFWIMFGIALVVNAWGNIEIGWREGDPSTNRFGPPTG